MLSPMKSSLARVVWASVEFDDVALTALECAICDADAVVLKICL